VVARWPLADILFARFGENRNQPPLHFLLVQASLAICGAPGGPIPVEVAARLPFALAGTATCLLLVRAGARWVGQAASVAGAALLATSYGQIAQSVEARPYALLTFWTLLAVLALDRALDGPPGQARYWAVTVGAALGGVASSYLMVYAVLPGLGVYAAVRLRRTLWAALWGPAAGAARRAMRAPLIAGGILVLGTLPALPEMLSFSWAGQAWPDNPPDAIVKLLLYNGLAFGPAPAPPWAIGLAGLAAGGAWGAWRAGDRARRGLGALCAVGGGGLLALSVSGSSELVAPRYWSYSEPFLCLLAGAGLAGVIRGLTPRIPRGRAVLALALLGLVFSGVPGVLGALAHQEVPPGAPYRPDFRLAARVLATAAAPGDLVLILDDQEHGWRVADWYWRTVAGLPAGVIVTDAADARLGEWAAPPRIYWLLGAEDKAFLARVAAAPPGGRRVVAQGERVLILEESSNGQVQPASALAALVASLQPVGTPAPRYLVVAQAMARQAQGDLAGAAREDQQAGRYRALGREHLANAAGFLDRGEPERALIDIAAARWLEPANAALRRAGAGLLRRAGDERPAASEEQLATLLP